MHFGRRGSIASQPFKIKSVTETQKPKDFELVDLK